MNRIDRYDLLAIARPVVDTLINVDERTFCTLGLRKGMADTITSREMTGLLGKLPGVTLVPGGSLSNTVAGLAALGARTAFLGKVADDVAGRVFRQAFHQAGVAFPTLPCPAGRDFVTSRCIVLGTPDKAQTVVFTPGVADRLAPTEMSRDHIAAAKLVYVEANLLTKSQNGTALGAMDIARNARRPVVLSLQGVSSDDPTLLRHVNGAEMVIGNAGEFRSLFGSDTLAPFVKGRTLMVMTEGLYGVQVAGRGECSRFPPHSPGDKPYPFGAGDAFAAGFLRGYGMGLSLDRCAAFGAEAADRIMAIPEARPRGQWADLQKKYQPTLAGTLRRASPVFDKGLKA